MVTFIHIDTREVVMTKRSDTIISNMYTPSPKVLSLHNTDAET